MSIVQIGQVFTLCYFAEVPFVTVKSAITQSYCMPRIEYDELKSLMQSSNHEINSLAEIVDNIKDRLEALERKQNEILDEMHKIKSSANRPK